MNREIYHYLQNRPELLHFVRMNPVWYRYLAREPNRVTEIEAVSKQFYGKTIPQKLDRLNHRMQMVGMLLQFAESMKD
ncbi:YlbE-like family protein [Ornithinibacillus halophilus]|uniref:YlbE-like protein n=1 Tax=Ornithinibacillus halophilus TaxID=930117 RepID=A0A1M5C2C9_9BACI|nr:YlbE-like family protein [Ornithinibacillus halophilus]SHF48944.1 YlbE-like protein [Ornithinibacillus halophilus]